MIRFLLISIIFLITVSCNDSYSFRVNNSETQFFPPSKKNVYKAKLKAQGILNCDARVNIIRNKNKSKKTKLKKGTIDTILFLGDYYGGNFGLNLTGCDSLNYSDLEFRVTYYN